MAASEYLFTSESVSEGHPDKVCDRISDTIVDAYLAADPGARVAAETLATTNRIVIAGEVRGGNGIRHADIEQLARDAVRAIGYEQSGFHWADAAVEILLHEQSPDIAMGVDAKGDKDEGAGDQGIMFGYACNETPELMPAPIQLAHRILRSMAEARHGGQAPYFGPDAKSQVTLRYVDGKPVGATSVVVSTQHDPAVSQAEIRELVRPFVLQALPEGWMCPEREFYVNPTGKFVVGGPDGDAGLTGRKIIVDTYGGAAPHGGGAFSGKDPTKVDRSAAYAARYLAKNVVAAGLADCCLIQLSYAIGISKPLSLYVDTKGTGTASPGQLSKVLGEIMDLSPRGIRERLGLSRPIYARTAAYGHFGREPEADGGFSWERTDLVRELRAAVMLAPRGDVAVAKQRLIYGRRQSRGLRPIRQRLLQERLPALQIEVPEAGRLDPWALFAPRPRALWLEIGFGAGEHLAAQAAAHPEVGLLGCEPFVEGVARLLALAEAVGLANLRIAIEDARLLLAALPDRCLERIFVLFPDPWPKARHHKRRIVNPATVAEFARLLQPDGELRLATDHAGYAEAMLGCVLACGAFAWLAERPDDWRRRPEDWPPTRYEQKAQAAGRPSVFFRFQRAGIVRRADEKPLQMQAEALI
jgi:S-adenosylmethionine synthetase